MNPQTNRNGIAMRTPGNVAQKFVTVISNVSVGVGRSGMVHGAIATR